MDPMPKQPKRRDNVLSSLNVIIEGLNIATNLSSVTPAKAVFSTVSVILTMIKASFLSLYENPSETNRRLAGLNDQRGRLRRPGIYLQRGLHYP